MFTPESLLGRVNSERPLRRVNLRGRRRRGRFFARAIRAARARVGVDLFGEVAERLMLFVELDEGRVLAPADLFGSVAARREGAARRQVRNVWREARNLVERDPFFLQRV